jgi:alkylation response protein AidB-like acyl-CoA dehydrogenase
MTGFPVERAAKRQALLDAVARVTPTLVAHAAEAETLGTLPAATVDALDEAGLFRLKLPAVLGGAEADPVTQFEVLEALAMVDASAAWCTMVGATTLTLPAVYLPDESVAKMFATGRIPRAAGVYMPIGRAVVVPGGYRVTGRWPFASGVRHSQWMSATARLVRDGALTSERRTVVFPTESAVVHDNWQVAGLQGTGSCDFSLEDLFVAEEFTWDAETAEPQRGGPLYRLAMPGFVANEHAAFALGVSRQALEVFVDVAKAKARGLTPSVLAGRAAVQRLVAKADLELQAARAVTVELYERAWQGVCAGEQTTPRMQAELRAVAVHATDVAVDVTTRVFRAAGGSALYLDHALQRCLRDLHAGAQHFMVSDSAYEGRGQFMLGVTTAHPMM